MRREPLTGPTPHFLLFAPVSATSPERATPEACHAYACRKVLAAAGGRALVVPSVVLEDMEGGGVKVSAFYARNAKGPRSLYPGPFVSCSFMP